MTLDFTIEHPPGLKELGQALAEKGTSSAQVAETVAKGGQAHRSRRSALGSQVCVTRSRRSALRPSGRWRTGASRRPV